MIKRLYTEQEEKALKELQLIYESRPNAEILKAWKAIESDADKRSLDYYSENLDELPADLIDEFETYLKKNSLSLNSSFSDKQYALTTGLLLLEPFMSFLKEKNENLYNNCLEKINDFFGKHVKHNNEHSKSKRDKENVKTQRPKKLISPNSKVSNTIFEKDNGDFYQGFQVLATEKQLRDAGKTAAKPIDVSVYLQYAPSDNLNIKLFGRYKGEKLTNFDRIVHDAVITQYVDGGNRYITTDMIAYVINGGKADNRTTEKLRNAINESIDRLFFTYAEIKADEQLKKYGVNIDDSGLRGRILEFSVAWVTINGQKSQCMEFTDKEPLLYKYANALGQIIRTDLTMLDIPGLQNYSENIELKNYLLHRIEVMLYDAKKPRIIRYDAIYDLLNVEAENPITLRVKKLDIRKKVKKCLDYWIKACQDKDEKGPRITGYKELKEGGEISKIEIEISHK